MGILLDILCIGLLAASAVVFAQKSVSSSLLSLGALLLALTAAFLLSLPLGAARSALDCSDGGKDRGLSPGRSVFRSPFGYRPGNGGGLGL